MLLISSINVVFYCCFSSIYIFVGIQWHRCAGGCSNVRSHNLCNYFELNKITTTKKLLLFSLTYKKYIFSTILCDICFEKSKIEHDQQTLQNQQRCLVVKQKAKAVLFWKLKFHIFLTIPKKFHDPDKILSSLIVLFLYLPLKQILITDR